MGIVYKAYDTVTKRFVALKTMWGDADPAAIELFEKEWTVLARLSHSNIVDILDTGEFRESGQRRPYFVMPLLPGATLDHLIKTSSQRLTVERSVEIILPGLPGLAGRTQPGADSSRSQAKQSFRNGRRHGQNYRFRGRSSGGCAFGHRA
jgi:serine/threonine protein kinase